MNNDMRETLLREGREDFGKGLPIDHLFDSRPGATESMRAAYERGWRDAKRDFHFSAALDAGGIRKVDLVDRLRIASAEGKGMPLSSGDVADALERLLRADASGSATTDMLRRLAEEQKATIRSMRSELERAEREAEGAPKNVEAVNVCRSTVGWRFELSHRDGTCWTIRTYPSEGLHEEALREARRFAGFLGVPVTIEGKEDR